MAIIDENYYTTVYIGQPIATADFARYEARAEDIIAGITKYQVTEEAMNNLPPQILTLYKKAICAQMEYFQYVGIDVASYGNASESFTVGKVSVSGGASIPTWKKAIICPLAYSYLEQTGLLNPQVGIIGAPFLPFWYGNGGWT
nr:MAG TPA: Head Tail Connector Protein [Caudoviricetes sp.]